MARPRLFPSALLLLLSISFQPAFPHTVVLDGAALPELRALRVGDSIIFKQVHGYDLYMFRSKRAADLCTLAGASLLLRSGGGGDPSSHFTWHPSGPGEYYFSYYYRNSSLVVCGARMCVQVMAVVPVSARSPAPSPLPGGGAPPAPTPGDDAAGDFFPSLPHARSSAASPRPSPGVSRPLPGDDDGTVPSSAAAPSTPAFPAGSASSGGVPFISSNPALPLPTGEADSATTSRPLPVTGGSAHPVGGTGLGIQMAAWLALAVGFA